jgi:hypothetical protein
LLDMGAAAGDSKGRESSPGKVAPVVPTSEEFVIARHTCRVLGSGRPEQRK